MLVGSPSSCSEDGAVAVDVAAEQPLSAVDDLAPARPGLLDGDAKGFARVTSLVFRKTAATELDAAGLSARRIANQLGHSKVSTTQDRFPGRRAVTGDVADALDRTHGGGESAG